MKQKIDLSDLVTNSYLNEVVKGIDENARKYRDEILTSNDGLMKKFEVMRDENTIGSHQTSQLNDTVENHEERIKHLEKAQQTA